MPIEKEETIINDPNEGSTWWSQEFTGEGIKPSELEFARVVVSDYCSPDQIRTLEAKLDSNGATLGSSRTLIKNLARVGDRLLADKDERESSKAASFFGSEMDDAVAAAVSKDAAFLISDAIQRASDHLVMKGRRPIPGQMNK